ncbi:MAG TPA: hypothetical protein DD437_05610 [Rhodobiaceae bacterium]|nr:hypothetical protein [Rhodobiaceae bacterium]|tara:strand:- start:5982 stop:6386 length:405 start_codon:yes stop_codon:yes gene_type:complete
MGRIFFTAFLLFAMSTTSGYAAFGRTQPIYNVQDKAAFTGSGQPTDAQQVHDAIVAGATSKGWQVRKVGDGHLVAQIFVRSHMAEIDITYDDDSYSIVYKNSTNLLYDGSTIHRNYNKWIKFMIHRIDDAMRNN